MVNKAYFPTVGGVEKVVQILAEGLREKRIKIFVLACRPDFGPAYVDRINRVPVLYAGSFGTFLSLPISLSFFWYLYKFGLRYSVVHWHEPFPLGSIGMFAVKKNKRIVTFHSDIVRQKFFRDIFIKLQIFLFNRSAKVISTSPSLINYSKVLRSIKHPVMSIPIGIKLAERPPKQEDLIKWKYENQPLKPYCLFVGRLVYYKGIKNLIEAMLATKARLVILGQGPLEGDIREFIKTKDFESKIILITESVNDEELKAWFYNCEFVILPSIEPSEAFGIVQVEAMAVGKAVINTNLPTGVPFVSINKKTGFTVEVNNIIQLTRAINKLWNNKKITKEYGKSAAIRAKKEFDSDVMVSRYIEAYTQMLIQSN
jgi:glycosyltransferase involved in cell wall biosynthesis